MINKNYSSKQYLQLLAILMLIIAALKISTFSIFLIAALLVYALIANNMEYTYGVLTLLLALSVINGVLVEKDFSFYLVVRGSLFVLAGALTARSGAKKNAWFLTPFYVLILYMIYIMFASTAGWAPLISELKAVLFLVFIVAFVYIVSAVNLKEVNIDFIRSMMLVVSSFYILGSVAVIPFPAIGQSMLRNIAFSYNTDVASMNLGSKSLFNGLTWHSQTLGPLISVLNAYVLSDYLCSFKKRNYLYLSLLLGAPLLIYKTSSRTALFAYLISIIASLFFFQRERNVNAGKKQKVILSFMFIGLLGGLFVLLQPSTRLEIEAFLRKQGDVSDMDRSDSLGGSILNSRMGLIEQGLENFRESPLLGNGFQVSKEMKYLSKQQTGLILSAPVEKGVLPVMILEEGGVLGALIFSAFIIMIYVKYSKLRMNCFLATFTTFVALNSGEATFFSTSGLGGILWCVCFSSLIIDVDRNRRALAEKQMAYFQGMAVR